MAWTTPRVAAWPTASVERSAPRPVQQPDQPDEQAENGRLERRRHDIAEPQVFERTLPERLRREGAGQLLGRHSAEDGRRVEHHRQEGTAPAHTPRLGEPPGSGSAARRAPSARRPPRSGPSTRAPPPALPPSVPATSKPASIGPVSTITAAVRMLGRVDCDAVGHQQPARLKPGDQPDAEPRHRDDRQTPPGRPARTGGRPRRPAPSSRVGSPPARGRQSRRRDRVGPSARATVPPSSHLLAGVDRAGSCGAAARRAVAALSEILRRPAPNVQASRSDPARRPAHGKRPPDQFCPRPTIGISLP